MKRAEMRLFYPDSPDLPLPAGHRFPAGKYSALRRMVVAEQILSAGWLTPSPVADDATLGLAHAPAYVAAIRDGTLDAAAVRRLGLPWSETLARRARAVVGGTLAASRAALADGVSAQLAGGTHHAHRDFGSGFCTFNDLAVAALALLTEGDCRRVAILDCDVHQGDGTAAILADEPRALTVSLHGEKNFPFRKVASDLDIGLADGATDADFLAGLELALERIDAFGPDLLFYLSGVDALASDRLGRLAMSHAGLMVRDRRVLGFAKDRGLPVAVAIGGGYAEPISDTIRAYANTFVALREVFCR